MIGHRVPEKGCTCVGRLVWSTITVEESSCRSLRPPFSQARRTDPTHPTKGFRQISGCPEPTLNAPVRRDADTSNLRQHGEMTHAPLFVVVSGPPGSGKTTLATGIPRRWVYP